MKNDVELHSTSSLSTWLEESLDIIFQINHISRLIFDVMEDPTKLHMKSMLMFELTNDAICSTRTFACNLCAISR